jgi:hypothetical protein
VHPEFDQFSEKVSENLMIASVINTLDSAKELKCSTLSIPVFKGFPTENLAYILINFCAKWAAS